jgi:signal transduction histidine kinase
VKPLRSLRSHLLVGTICWTIGLFFFAHLASVHLTHWYFEGPPHIVLTHTAFRNISLAIIAAAAVAMVAGWRHVRRGLSGLDRLRERLAAVRAGRATRLDGAYPTEVEPLVADLNALLDHREEVARRALAKAGDLAHGLKTPLAVLTQEAERAAGAGQGEFAATLEHELERMRRQIDYHLAQARAAGAGAQLGVRASPRESAEALARTLQRLHAARGLTIVIDLPAALRVRVQREDLDEMLGNLLDNACKWAASAVRIGGATAAGGVVLTVDDDGPGLPPELRETVLVRGVRADEASPGTGLGLAIVRELAALYEGSLVLEAAPTGGLRARLELPAA